MNHLERWRQPRFEDPAPFFYRNVVLRKPNLPLIHSAAQKQRLRYAVLHERCTPVVWKPNTGIPILVCHPTPTTRLRSLWFYCSWVPLFKPCIYARTLRTQMQGPLEHIRILMPVLHATLALTRREDNLEGLTLLGTALSCMIYGWFPLVSG